MKLITAFLCLSNAGLTDRPSDQILNRAKRDIGFDNYEFIQDDAEPMGDFYDPMVDSNDQGYDFIDDVIIDDDVEEYDDGDDGYDYDEDEDLDSVYDSMGYTIDDENDDYDEDYYDDIYDYIDDDVVIVQSGAGIVHYIGMGLASALGMYAFYKYKKYKKSKAGEDGTDEEKQPVRGKRRK